MAPSPQRRPSHRRATGDAGTGVQELIEAELDSPLELGAIATLARGPEEVTEIYVASLPVVDPDAPAAKAYLALRAARLDLAPGLVPHPDARTADLA